MRTMILEAIRCELCRAPVDSVTSQLVAVNRCDWRPTEYTRIYTCECIKCGYASTYTRGEFFGIIARLISVPLIFVVSVWIIMLLLIHTGLHISR